jgi:Uma2 family endonuclease
VNYRETDPMSISAPVSPPPLRDGDRLTSDEFMRRWEAMPDLKHAELIDGIVYMSSPLSREHGVPHFDLAGWLSGYAANTPGCGGDIECTWLMGERDVPQPDLSLWISPQSGGQSRVAGDYAAGAPELIVEVAAFSRTRDLGVKLRLYQWMGVREYLVAVVTESKFIWHEQTANGFQELSADPDGILRSRYFPGLWLDPAAFWSRDRALVHAVLQQGLATPEHPAFVARLAAHRK